MVRLVRGCFLLCRGTVILCLGLEVRIRAVMGFVKRVEDYDASSLYLY